MAKKMQEQLSPAELAEARRLELAEITKRHRGKLRPVDVVEYAKNPGTYLHSLFTWNDTEAASQYRLQQASAYIRAVAVIEPHPDSGKSISYRAYVSLPNDRGTGVYRHIDAVSRDHDMRESLLEQARSDYAAFRKKYSGLKELAAVWSSMDRVFNSIVPDRESNQPSVATRP